MTSTQVWQAAGYGQQEGMIGIVVWKAAMCGRHTGYGKQEGMIGNVVWKATRYGRTTSSVLWNAQWYGKPKYMAGSDGKQ